MASKGKPKFQRKSDQEFYESKSWGSVAIPDAKDLPTLKLQRLMEVVSARKKKDAALLEVGCGAGRILATIKKKDRHLKLTGVDISAHEIKIAKRDNKGIAFVRANGEHLPFKDNTFDYVVFLDYIEHVDNPDRALQELHRVVKKGGLLYGVSPTEKHGFYGISTKILGWHIKEKTAGHIQQYTVKSLLKKVEDAGFTVDKKRTTFSYHLLGGAMDYALFAMLLNKRFGKLFWGKNKYWKDAKTKQSVASRAMNGVLSLANAVAYGESTLLKRTRFTATAVHIVARKGGK